MMSQSLTTDFTTCENTADMNDRYAKCYNQMAKIITEGLSNKYQNNNFVVIVGESMNFYNHWSTAHTEVLYRVRNLHFLVIKF